MLIILAYFRTSGVSERRGRSLFGGIDPVSKHGPGTVADLRVVTPLSDPG